MALSPSRRIFYMKYSSHLPLNYDNLFKMTPFIVMEYVCFQYGINAQSTKNQPFYWLFIYYCWWAKCI